MVVQQNDSALAVREKMFQCKNLPPIAQGSLRQQTQFGQAVYHHPGGVKGGDLVEHQTGGLA
ncbi:hypothetical protein D3C72_2146660 [compost metagenome]